MKVLTGAGPRRQPEPLRTPGAKRGAWASAQLAGSHGKSLSGVSKLDTWGMERGERARNVAELPANGGEGVVQ